MYQLFAPNNKGYNKNYSYFCLYRLDRLILNPHQDYMATHNEAEVGMKTSMHTCACARFQFNMIL